MKTRIVGRNALKGELIAYESGHKDRMSSLLEALPSNVNKKRFCQVFKDDIVNDAIIEKYENCHIYYLTNSEGRGDELYYFKLGDSLFHGDRVWSEFHGFVRDLEKIKPSHYLKGNSWFIGSRNNYTHQMVDFFPNLLLLRSIIETKDCEMYNIIFGKPNKILEELIAYDKRVGIAEDNIKIKWLAEFGKEVELGNWSVKCIAFESLYIARHISAYKSFELLNRFFLDAKERSANSSHKSLQRTIGIITRQDQRVANQEEIIGRLKINMNVETIGKLDSLSFEEKMNKLNGYDTLIIPPGSDNINCLCFSNMSCKLLQLYALDINKALESPFYSLAGIRYLLPFMHRTNILSASERFGGHSGIWSSKKIEEVLVSQNQDWQRN